MGTLTKLVFYVCFFHVINMGVCVASEFSDNSDTELTVLINQLSYWQGQNDGYQESILLKKLAKIDSNHPVYLEAKAITFLKKEQFQQARNLLMKFRQVSTSHEKVERLAFLVTLFEKHRTTLGEARLLAKGKLYQKSLQKYDSIIHAKPLHREFALEYLDVLTRVKPETEAATVKYFERLSNQYPGNAKYQINYLKYRLDFSDDVPYFSDQFEVLLANNIWQEEAQRLWQKLLIKTEVTHQTQAYFLRYLSYFPTDNFVKLPYEQGLIELEAYDRMAALPEHKALVKALKLLEAEADIKKIKYQLSIAKRRFANDGRLLSAYALVYLREGTHQDAINSATKCIAIGTSNVDKCRSLLQTAMYWQKIAKVKGLFQQGDYKQAKVIIDDLDDSSNEGNYHILLNAHYYQHCDRGYMASLKYREYLALDPTNVAVWNQLFELNSTRLTDTVFRSWYRWQTAAIQSMLKPKMLVFRASAYKDEAEQLLRGGDARRALHKFEQALNLTPEDDWLRYDIAKIHLANNDQESFSNLYQPKPNTPEGNFAYALLLASQDKYQSAIEVIDSTPLAQRSAAMVASRKRFVFEDGLNAVEAESDAAIKRRQLESLWRRYLNDKALLNRLASSFEQYGYYEQAITSHTYLQRIEPDKYIDHQLAKITLYQNLKRYEESERALHPLLVHPALTAEHKLQLIQLSLAQLSQHENSKVLTLGLNETIMALRKDMPFDPDMLIASASFAAFSGDIKQQWQDLKALVEHYPDNQVYQQQVLSLMLVPGNIKGPLSDDSNYIEDFLSNYITEYPFDPLGYEAASEVLEQTASKEQYLLRAYKSSLLQQKALTFGVDSTKFHSQYELLGRLPNNPEFAELLHAINGSSSRKAIEWGYDHWAVNRIRTKLLEQNAQQHANVELGFNGFSDSGTSGTSDMTLNVLSLALNVPFQQSILGKGLWYIRVEPTSVDAGVLDVSETKELGSLILCTLDCNVTDTNQKDTGYAIAFGLDMPNWRADIGTTPLGFAKEDIVGGIEFDGDLADLGWTLSATKRPLTSSLLSYAGTKDPYSDLFWGAARIYNLGASLSYDLGEGFGAWSVTDHALITGEQIKKNTRTRIMGGAYYSIWDDEWLTVDVGMNLFYWTFKHDLSYYSLGHGGYYSPQSYQSVSLPFAFYGREGRWSYKVDLSVSLSQSKTDDIDYFVLHNKYQDKLENFADGQHLGGDSRGTGFYAKGALEYKLGSHWLLGGALTLQESEYYSPNSLLLYLRYTFGVDYLPVPKPPKFITPYKDFY